MKNKKVLISSVIYFLLGNLVVMTMSPTKQILGFGSDSLLWLIFAILTLPLDIFLMGAFMASDSVLLFILFEIIGFFISWIIVYVLLKIVYIILKFMK